MDPNERLRLLTLLPLSFRTVGRLYSLNSTFRSFVTEVYWMNRLLSLNRPLLSINVNSARYYRFLETSFGKIKSYKDRGITLSKDQEVETEYYGSKIDIGNDFTVALVENGVLCRGLNDHGQCAQKYSTYQERVETLILGRFRDVACGGTHTLILRKDGRVSSFGSSSALGYTPKTLNNPIPTVIPNLPPVSLIVAGYQHSVFLTREGTVYTCGLNDFGQLGDSSVIDRILPTEIVFPRRVVEISANERSTFFLLENGEGYISGYNPFIDGITTEPQRVVPDELLIHGKLFDWYESDELEDEYVSMLMYTTNKGDTFGFGKGIYFLARNGSIYNYSVNHEEGIKALSYINHNGELDTSVQSMVSRYKYTYLIV